jgi:hypothetical protein
VAWSVHIIVVKKIKGVMIMDMPIIDWEIAYRDLYEKYLQGEKDVIRLDMRVQYLKDENEQLRQRLEFFLVYKGTIETVCPECGESFRQKKHGRTRIYCSDACKMSASRIRIRLRKLQEASLVTDSFVTMKRG